MNEQTLAAAIVRRPIFCYNVQKAMKRNLRGGARRENRWRGVFESARSETNRRARDYDKTL